MSQEKVDQAVNWLERERKMAAAVEDSGRVLQLGAVLECIDGINTEGLYWMERADDNAQEARELREELGEARQRIRELEAELELLRVKHGRVEVSAPVKRRER